MLMEELIRKSHNVSLLMYHFVFVSKYGRLVITEEVDSLLKETCLEISKRYDLRFLVLGTEGDHVHLLIQSVPAYSITKIVKTVKSITAREIFTKVPSVKKKLWWGGFFYFSRHKKTKKFEPIQIPAFAGMTKEFVRVKFLRDWQWVANDDETVKCKCLRKQ